MAVTHRHASLDPSPSPPPQREQTLSKRDVRRNRIMERLQGMIDSFTANQHHHYCAQLQAVQVDMTLVLRADPYDGAPLEDSGEEVRSLVESMLGAGSVGDEAAQRDYLAMAGKRCAEFAREVNDELEKRDADLVALHNNYHSSVAELERLTQQKLHQAEGEHKALSNTIRLRLQASLTKKRQHLLREKEQLDIADSNALLLHPSHFGINNPGSPGGGQNRKTRHLRHRAGSPSAGELGGENGKRKRKAAALDDDGNESPAPGFRPLPPPDALGGGRSPFKDAREKNTYIQFEAPAYSLERIFTDKELAMASATAQQATYRYFHQAPQDRQAPEHATSTGNGTTVPSVDGETLPDAPAAADGPDIAHPTTEGGPSNATPPPAAAPEMERQTSHQVLTRGGARANPLAALSDLATAAAASASAPVRDDPFAPVVPAYHAISRVEKSGAPAPPGVGPLDVESDFDMMRRAGDPVPDAANVEMAYDVNASGGQAAADDPAAAKELRGNLLDRALGLPSVAQPYRLPLLETGPANVGARVERPSWTGFAQVANSFEQQRLRQAVANAATTTGFGVVGAAAAAAGVGGRLAAALQGRMGGGEAMSRTTSAGGGSEGGDVGGGVGRRGGRGRVV